MSNKCKTETVDFTKDNALETFLLHGREMFVEYPTSIGKIEGWKSVMAAHEAGKNCCCCDNLESVMISHQSKLDSTIPKQIAPPPSPLNQRQSTFDIDTRTVRTLKRSRLGFSFKNHPFCTSGLLESQGMIQEMSESNSPVRYHVTSALLKYRSTGVLNPKSKTRGYPTYFDRFLATIFSWDPDWCERSTICFDLDQLKLPAPFIWLENGLKTSHARNFSFRNYSELKSTYIPIILRQLFKEVTEKRLNDGPTVAIVIKSMTCNDYSAKSDHLEEKAFLSEVHFKIQREYKNNLVLKKGDLVVIKTKLHTVYSQFALVSGVHTKCSKENVNSGDDLFKIGVQDSVTLLMKKTLAKKLNQKVFEVVLVMNIESFVLQGKAVYDFNSCRTFFRSFMEPKVQNQCPPTTFNSKSYTNEENAAINSIIGFVNSHSERDNILVVSSSQDDLRKKDVFLAAIEQIIVTSKDTDEKLLIIVPKEFEWSEFIVAQFMLSALKGLNSGDVPKMFSNVHMNTPELIENWVELKSEKRYGHWFDLVDEKSLQSPFALFKLEEMKDEINKIQISSSRIILSSFNNLLTQSMKSCFQNCQFRSCMIYDDGLSQPEICAIGTWTRIDSLVMFSSECPNRRSPANFASRFASLGHCIQF